MRSPLMMCMVLALCVAACSRGDGAAPDSAEGVADRFVDLYVVEIDQQHALALTTGDARKRVEQELEDVAAIRQQGYSANAAKPRVFYDRVMFEANEQAGTGRAIYDVRIKADSVETRRHILLSLSRRDGAWLVAGFFLQDGPANPAAE